MSFQLRRPPSFSAKHRAYPYQVDAVEALSPLPYGAVFHEQGLGKTKIAIDVLLTWLEDDVLDTVFVVTKKHLVQNWVDEISMHCHVTPSVLGTNRRRNALALTSPGLIYVTNYDTVRVNEDLFADFLRTCRVGVILDESQAIKNPDTAVARTFHSLASLFSRRLIVTGTPVANRPYDLWSQIKFLDQGAALGCSFDRFKEAHDLPRQRDAEVQAAYNARLAATMDKLASFSVRETKRTAGIHLPKKTVRTHRVTMAPLQRRLYAAFRDQMAVQLRHGNTTVADDLESLLKRLLRLVQCASHPRLLDPSYDEEPGKLGPLADLVRQASAENTKVVIWTQFVQNVEWLSSYFADYYPQRFHGGMRAASRHRSLLRFRKDPRSMILVATPASAKEGLTLTEASHAVFFDRSFSLDDYQQAQDRIHRLSQTRHCFVHNLLAADTVDEWVDALLATKHHAARLAHGDASPADGSGPVAGNAHAILRALLEPSWPE